MTKNPFDEEYAGRIRENIKRIRENVARAAEESGRRPEDIAVMAVTKTVAAEYVNVAVAEGITLLGENRAQELLDKYDDYSLDWRNIHFIGHLQTNKVKYIIDKVSMVQSLDSLKLAKEIDRRAKNAGKLIDVLIEVNIGRQESKAGIDPDLLQEFLFSLTKYSQICVKGLMAIPPPENTEKYFEKMQALFLDMRGKKMDNVDITVLSMGMSADYRSAIRFGANIVRLGAEIFGQRK